MTRRMSTLAHERAIIDALKQNPKSMRALEEELSINYYTVRRVIENLVKRNIVRVYDVVDRNTIYTYTGSETEHDHIPRVTDIVNKVSVKAVILVDSAGNEDSMRAVVAAKRIPYHMTNLMQLAIQAEQGLPVGKQLDRIREELTKDFLYTKNAANVYEQILKEPRFWEPSHLAKMPQDPDFNPSVILKIWDYYSQEEDE